MNSRKDHPEAVEAGARNLHRHGFSITDGPWSQVPEAQREMLRDQAAAALDGGGVQLANTVRDASREFSDVEHEIGARAIADSRGGWDQLDDDQRAAVITEATSTLKAVGKRPAVRCLSRVDAQRLANFVVNNSDRIPYGIEFDVDPRGHVRFHRTKKGGGQ